VIIQLFKSYSGLPEEAFADGSNFKDAELMQ
jgi:hypothetical protein